VIRVELLTYTPDPEKVVAMAARLCYSATGAAELKERLTEEETQKMVGKMISLGHGSTIEHVSFTFGIEGISRVLSHQLVRHRIASYDQQSQRYVREHNFLHVTPPSVAENPAAAKKYREFMETSRAAYEELISLGIPQEDARYVLAGGAETKIMVTMNARSLHHFFNLRCCLRAQWEIREMANLMLAEVKKVAPTLFKNAGASCVNSGRCPEGNMTCGRLTEMLKLREP
jgi:thymidylate synthase (FAD)